MNKLIIRLKSGHEIPITCEDFTFKVDRLSGELTDYEIKGIKDNVPLYFRMTDVECVVENRDGTTDRPQGEWIYTMNPLRLNDEWECSKCGYLSFTKANYCGHCGCRMKGADDE